MFRSPELRRRQLAPKNAGPGHILTFQVEIVCAIARVRDDFYSKPGRFRIRILPIRQPHWWSHAIRRLDGEDSNAVPAERSTIPLGFQFVDTRIREINLGTKLVCTCVSILSVWFEYYGSRRQWIAIDCDLALDLRPRLVSCTANHCNCHRNQHVPWVHDWRLHFFP